MSTNLFMAKSSRNAKNNSGPVIGVDHPTQPGEVMLFKQAEQVPGTVNLWKVTLRIEGKDFPKTSDIILVMDTSGSMAYNNRMQEAKNAANAFIDALLPSDNTRIGIVPFASSVSSTSIVPLTNDPTTLHNAVNSLYANGGTFTQGGVKQAEAMLDNSTADFKHIVLLSDGEPTYSYAMHNMTNYTSYEYIAGQASYNYGWGECWYYDMNIYRYSTTANAPSTAYNYNTRVGCGTHMYHRGEYVYGNNSGYRYYNHGNSAIAEAGFAKAKNQRVWTIALEVNQTGQNILSQMASPNSYYTATPEELEIIFGDIAGQIGAAITDAVIEDPMGHGFYRGLFF